MATPRSTETRTHDRRKAERKKPQGKIREPDQMRLTLQPDLLNCLIFFLGRDLGS